MAAFTVVSLLVFLGLGSHLAAAQLIQDYIRDTNVPQGVDRYLYQPSSAVAPVPVLDIRPRSVWLVYNCYYMEDICENSKRFMEIWGSSLHTQSGLPQNVFGFDFYTNRKDQNAHSERRRDASCPATWKNIHTCPEIDQRNPWRDDVEWWTDELEPGTTINELRHLRAGQNIVGRSNIRYSCDEFPPATWVEGGDGAVGGRPSETRCAAIACARRTKAEQNWQGISHNILRNALTKSAKSRYGPGDYGAKSRHIILFRFHKVRVENNGIAAWVHTFADPDGDIPAGSSQVYQGFKRSVGPAENETFANSWLNDLTYDDLLELLAAGHVTQEVVAADHGPMDTPNLASVRVGGIEVTGNASLKHGSRPESSSARQEPSLLASREPVPQNASHVPTTAPLLSNSSSSDLQKARDLVANAIAASARLNQARLQSPRRNRYTLRPGTVVGSGPAARRQLRARDDAPPLLDITDEIARAAALVAEADAAAQAGNLTKRQSSGTFWMGGIARQGTVPWGGDNSYAVFRNVRSFGAVGDGVTDDTAAIKNAMLAGNRCGVKCNGATTKNAIVYFPPGTYLISSTIALPFGTQVIGDANNRPKLLASASFIGLGVLSTDEYTGGGTGADGLDQEYYINTANFYRQIRNIVIDVRGTAAAQKVTCLHYQVAQATSLQNVELVAGPNQSGMFAENGSGGQISDVTFTGGNFGLYGGNQQFTAQRLKFNGCTTGVQVIWDWGWVWKSVTMTNVGTGFRLLPEGSQGNIGSASVIDSSFTNVGTAIIIAPPSSAPGSGSTGLVLQNVALSGVAKAVADSSGNTLLAGSAGRVDEWVLGPVYNGTAEAGGRRFSNGGRVGNYKRPSTLINPDGSWYERPKPQYEDRPVSDFVHVKAYGATGDGTTDDTAAFQAAVYASVGRILFVDAGSYVLTSTVTIPSKVKIVGETWSQLVAYGPNFQSSLNPRVMLRVGDEGEIGDVEMQDLIFTTKGPTPGAILVEWNMRALTPGSAALWDCHARVGGATGTQLTPADCPPVTSGTNQACAGASLMMHLTKSASGYFENMWLWVADHMIDDPDLNDANNTMVQTSIYVARGFLIESTHATWLYGTASEHSVMYQYNFHDAANVFAGMLQTESPYYQPNPKPPAPFLSSVGLFAGDPTYSCAAAGNEFDGCDESWAVVIRRSQNIFVAGAGLYSWFSTYAQTCIDSQLCQKVLVLLDSNLASVRIQHLITIGAKYMAVMNGKGLPAAANLNVNSHPFWSQISVLDVASNTTQYNDVVWISPDIWTMAQPQFTCSPPCHVKIPPWTGATSTVDYPLLTVSAGTWTSTITKAPLTITEWIFQPVTLTQAPGNKHKRQGFADFWPTPATTPFWPSVLYTGPDGQETVVGPTVPFPTPPPSIGPGAPAPPRGNWPTRAVRPVVGLRDSPWEPECGSFDPDCVQKPWMYGDGSGLGPDGDDDDLDENWKESRTTCGASTSSTVIVPPPSPSPLEEANPRLNALRCFDSGIGTEHIRMDNTITSGCNDIGSRFGSVLKDGDSYKRSFDLPYNGQRIWIDVSIQVKEGCQWTYSLDDCRHYFSRVVDGCNCGGVDGKQGGWMENNCMSVMLDPNII